MIVIYNIKICFITFYIGDVSVVIFTYFVE
jgi:hypothetical protein